MLLQENRGILIKWFKINACLAKENKGVCYRVANTGLVTLVVVWIDQNQTPQSGIDRVKTPNVIQLKLQMKSSS